MADKDKKIHIIGQLPKVLKPKTTVIGAAPTGARVSRPVTSLKLATLTNRSLPHSSLEKTPEPAFKITTDEIKSQPEPCDDAKKGFKLANDSTQHTPPQSAQGGGDPAWADWDPRDLGPEVTDSILQAAFAPCGTSLTKARVARDHRSGKSRGYGFVAFKEPEDFLKAMREMNGKYIGSRPVKLKRSTGGLNLATSKLDSITPKNKRKRK